MDMGSVIEVGTMMVAAFFVIVIGVAMYDPKPIPMMSSKIDF